MSERYRAGSGGGGVGRLTAQKNAQKKAPKKSTPGVLTRVLDVLSRGQYASAGAAMGKGPKESLSMAWKGLQGKQKTSYADVLSKRLGVRGKPAAVLGFIGDVGLDPTTYLGFGLGKTAIQAGGKVAGKELGQETVKQTGKKATKNPPYMSSGAQAIMDARKLEQAAKAATPVAKKKGGATLYKPPTPVGKKGAAKADEMIDMSGPPIRTREPITVGEIAAGKVPAKSVPAKSVPAKATRTVTVNGKVYVNPGVAKAAPKAGAALTTSAKLAPEAAQGVKAAAESGAAKVAGAADSALPARPTGRALELKMMGKTIARSEKGYDAAAKVLRPLGQSDLGNLLGRTFRTGHGLPQEIRNIQRKSVGVGMGDLHDKLFDIKTTFANTTKAQRREIASAIDRGTVDALDDTLRPLAQYAQKNLDGLGSTEGLGKAKSMKEADDLASKLPSHSDDIADRLAKEYDKAITRNSYNKFRAEVDERFGHLLTDPEIRRALDKTEKAFTPQSAESHEWLRLFDRTQGYWKMAVTAPNPSFHIRNMIGDSWLNYLDGVVSPIPYKKSAEIVIRGNGKNVKIKVGDKFLSGDDVMAIYKEQGLPSRFTQTENLVGGTSSKVLDTIGELSNKREDFGRLAHFIDALGKEAKHGRKLEDAVEAAAERVRKFNIDYSDLTEVERKSLKRVMPFYTFVRKALPVQLEMLFTRPGRVAVLPKGKQAIERLIGVRGEGDESPLPGIDENLPPWMRDSFNVSMGNNRVRSPDFPIDLIGQYANPIEGMLEGVTPFIKGPVELGTGKTVPSGFKQKASIPRYLLNQTPITRQVGNYAWGDEDAPEKTARWLAGPLVSKVVSKAEAKDKKKKSTSSSSSGTYRAGS